MTRVLVTGAPGFVGQALCQELKEHNYSVRGLHRPSSNTTALTKLGVELVAGDLTDRSSLEKAMQGCEIVFHIGAIYRQAKFGDSVYWQVNFEGTRNALEAAKAAGVKRFIHCSTTGVHGTIKNPPADENAPYAPCDVYQESKTEAEKLVKEWTQSGKIDGCIIRPIMIWGPGDTRFLKLFRGIAKRTLPIIGSGKSLCHWVLVSDLARGFRLAAENPASRGQVYLIGGDRPVTLEYTMQTIAAEFGVSILPFKIPALPIQIAGSIVEAICKPFGIEPPLHRRRVDFYVKDRAFSCAKAERELGYKPTYTFEEEAKLIAHWYIENGWITQPHHAKLQQYDRIKS